MWHYIYWNKITCYMVHHVLLLVINRVVVSDYCQQRFKKNKKMLFVFVSVESVATAAIFFLWTCSLSEADIQTAQTNLIRSKKVATSYMTLQSYSKIKCVDKCLDEKRQNRCNVAGYNKATRTCFLSNDSQQDLLDAYKDFGVILFSQSAGMFRYD